MLVGLHITFIAMCFLFFFYKDKLFRETSTGHSPSSQVIRYTVGKNRTSTSVRCGEVVSQSLRIRPNIFYSFGGITINFSFIAKTEPRGGRGEGVKQLPTYSLNWI